MTPRSTALLVLGTSVMAAVATGIGLPLALGTAVTTGVVAGVGVVILGAIGHEGIARRAFEGRVTRRLRRMAQTQVHMADELAMLKERIDHLDGRGGGQTLEAEVRAMKVVLERLTPEHDTIIDVPDNDLNTEFGQPERARILTLLREGIENGRIDVFLQPIVSLPQRKDRFWEVFGRIRTDDGGHLAGDQYLSVAREENLVVPLDNLLLLRSIALVRDLGKGIRGAGYFLNISSATLVDYDFMNDLVRFLSDRPDLAPKLVFEMSQTDFDRIDATGFRLVDELARLGCRFSMDRVADVALDGELLAARHVRFIKLDGRQIVQAIKDDRGLERFRSLKGQLDRAAVDLIVEKIESESDLREILDLNVDFGQGFLFGEPRLINQQTLSDPADRPP